MEHPLYLSLSVSLSLSLCCISCTRELFFQVNMLHVIFMHAFQGDSSQAMMYFISVYINILQCPGPKLARC